MFLKQESVMTFVDTHIIMSRNVKTVYIDDFKHIIYYSTTLLKINNDIIIFNTGGWRTRSTANIINKNIPDFIKIYQKHHNWYIRINDTDMVAHYRFYDGVEFNLNTKELVFNGMVLYPIHVHR